MFFRTKATGEAIAVVKAAAKAAAKAAVEAVVEATGFKGLHLNGFHLDAPSLLSLHLLGPG